MQGARLSKRSLAVPVIIGAVTSTLKTTICVVVIAFAAGAALAASVDEVLARAEELRNGGNFADAIVALREVLQIAPDHLRAHRLLAQTLAWNKEFAQAESAYRAGLLRWPEDTELRSGLAQVLLWSNRFREGERLFARLVRERPEDNAALLGAAQGAYWSGDYRSAMRRFETLVQRDPANADALRALGELRALMRSRYDVRGQYASDTQPLRRTVAVARFGFFSDPLTHWDVRGSAGAMEHENRDLGVRSVGLSGTTTIPSMRTTVSAGIDRQWFDDGSAENLANASVSWKVGREIVALTFDQFTLLGTASAIERRESASRISLAWRHDRERGLQAAATAHALRYTDDNDGFGADIYALQPLLRRGSMTLRGGLSAAWRDSREDRFRFTGFQSEQRTDGLFDYSFSGVYDPYWTPNDLSEGRVIASIESVSSRAQFRIQADGGYARERARGFGPAFDVTPSPTFTFPITLSRTYNPWRVSAELTIPINQRIEFRARARREATAFYNVNEFEASLGGYL
jgi:tetratricopeptide (TPR) repeat protein